MLTPPDFHIRVGVASAEEAQGLARQHEMEFVRLRADKQLNLVAEFLATASAVTALEAKQFGVETIARLNTIEDLDREVSQLNRFEARLNELRHKRKRR